VSAVLIDGLEAEEGLGLKRRGTGGIPPEDGSDELRELVGPALDVGHALVKGNKAGERLGAWGLWGEDWDEAVGGVGDGAAEGELDLGINPVHDAAAADVDGKRGGAVPDSLLELGLPRLPCAQVVLVEPDAQAVFPRLGSRFEALLQPTCRFGIDPSMAQKEQKRQS
jgi:hypothetical protein